jgi:7,8-dihydropterin-6-yl-methyl-4-(beta-D-ribofuranosyl)aminobenzene 5'-phosphate synthase
MVQDIMDERYAAVDVLGKGLVIFSALSDLDLLALPRLMATDSCSHAGIVNVVKDAVERFSRPIYMVRF